MEKNIYISYAWKDRDQEMNDSREEIVNKLCDAFEKKGYHVKRDKADMKYRDVIREFLLSPQSHCLPAFSITK